MEILFIIAGISFFISAYSIGWSNGFSAGERHASQEVEVIIPEIIPPNKESELPARYY